MTGDPLPLTPEEASTLAKRWAVIESVIAGGSLDDLDEEEAAAWLDLNDIAERPLTDPDPERLFAWVRVHHLHILAMGLGITADQAMDLCRAAGCGLRSGHADLGDAIMTSEPAVIPPPHQDDFVYIGPDPSHRGAVTVATPDGIIRARFAVGEKLCTQSLMHMDATAFAGKL